MLHTYGLFYPENYPIQEKRGTMFYFGKGSNLNRRDRHEYEASHNIERNPHKNNVIREIWSFGYSVVKRNFFSHATNDDACMYEIATIFLMPQLTNIAIGGDGGMLGKKHSLATRKQMSMNSAHIKLCGANNPMYGRNHTPASIEKIKATCKYKLSGANNPMYGRNHTPATIAKMQQSALNRWSSNK